MSLDARQRVVIRCKVSRSLTLLEVVPDWYGYPPDLEN